MKSLETLKESLIKANSELMVAEKIREGVIEKELKYLDEVIELLGDEAMPMEIINSKKAYLIYAFDSNGKRTISNKVFYCEDKKIRYQVYKQDEYLGYNPLAQFEGSYAVVEANEMFKNIDLNDVLQFLSEQTVDIPEKAMTIKNDALKRSQILE